MEDGQNPEITGLTIGSRTLGLWQNITSLIFLNMKTLEKLFFDVGILPVGKACNLKCRGCFWGKRGKTRFIRADGIFSDRLLQIGLERCFVGGGEPFLHPKIVDVIKKFSSNISIRYMLTNGLMLSRNIPPLDKYIDTLVISVDKMHEEAVLEQKSIDYLNETFSSIRDSTIHSKIRINSVIKRHDLPHLLLIRKHIAREKKIKGWHIYPSTPNGISSRKYRRAVDRINFQSPLSFKVAYKIPRPDFMQTLILPDYSIETLIFRDGWKIERTKLGSIFMFRNLEELVREGARMHGLIASSLIQTDQKGFLGR